MKGFGPWRPLAYGWSTLLVVAEVAGCSPAVSSTSAADAPSARHSAATAWVAVRSLDAVPLLTVPARVLPSASSSAVVSAPSRARVVSVAAAVGDEVAVGGPLVEVALPGVAEAAGRLRAARAKKAAYRRVLRQLRALDRHGLARLADRADVEVKLAEAAADAEVALAALDAAGFTPERAETLAKSGGRTTLTSPVAGRIAESRAVRGAAFSPDDGPLFRVVAEAGRRLEARVPPALAALPGGRFFTPGGKALEVTRVGCVPEVEPVDATLRCWFDVAEELPARLPGTLELRPAAGEPVFAVPTAAVGLDEAGAFVITLFADGSVAPVGVQPLGRVGADTLVEGALTLGQKIAAVAPPSRERE